jgi:starch-binding outer membrane protein, SusD/RagB family
VIIQKRLLSNYKKNKMKKIFNRFSILALLASMSLGACKKSFIERTPFDQLSSDDALSSESALQSALNGAYSRLRSASLFGRDLPVIGDIHADNTFVETKNAGRYLLWYNYTLSDNDGNASGMWTTAYTGILRANRIIDADVTTGSVSEIKGQAYGLRGLLYFELVNMFAKPFTDDPSGLGVPLVTTYDPYFFPSRNTIQEVYTQIVSDLTTGFQTAPAYSSSARLSKYAIEALLARVYLFMGDYANAKTAAEDVINNSGFTLVGSGSLLNYWANAADRTDKVETLFEVDADVIDNNAFDDLGAIYINGYQDIYASRDLYDLYSATDVRKDLMIDDVAKSGAAAVLVNKFPNAQNGDRDNLKVIRLSEVYLTAAEASAKLATPDEVAALSYLNALVSKRDPALVYASAGAQLIDDIITERRKELAFEGDRLFTLNRLKMPINRIANTPASIPAPLSIAYPDDYRIAPIPLVEIQANPNIADQQNPGY